MALCLWDQRETLTLNHEAGHPLMMLVFSSSFSAQDYIRATNAEVAVREFRLSSLCEIGRGWISAGVNKFVLDRLPRCSIN
jgi:hypothetical protein